MKGVNTIARLFRGYKVYERNVYQDEAGTHYIFRLFRHTSYEDVAATYSLMVLAKEPPRADLRREWKQVKALVEALESLPRDN